MNLNLDQFKSVIQLPVIVVCKCGNRAQLNRLTPGKPLLKCKQCGRVQLPQEMKIKKIK